MVEKDGNLNVDPLSMTIIDLSVLPNIFGEGKIVFEDSHDVLAITSNGEIVLNENQEYTADEVIYQATSNQTGVEWSLVAGGDFFNIDASTGELKLNAVLNFDYENRPNLLNSNQSIIIRGKNSETNEVTESYVIVHLNNLLELAPTVELRDYEGTNFSAGEVIHTAIIDYKGDVIWSIADHPVFDINQNGEVVFKTDTVFNQFVASEYNLVITATPADSNALTPVETQALTIKVIDVFEINTEVEISTQTYYLAGDVMTSLNSNSEQVLTWSFDPDHVANPLFQVDGNTGQVSLTTNKQFEEGATETLHVVATNDKGIRNKAEITFAFVRDDTKPQATVDGLHSFFADHTFDINTVLFNIHGGDATSSNLNIETRYDPDNLFEIDGASGDVKFTNETTIDPDQTYFAVFRVYDDGVYIGDVQVDLNTIDIPEFTSEDQAGLIENLHYFDRDVLLDVNTDLDALGPVFSLSDDHGGKFEINATTGEVSFIANRTFFDYEEDITDIRIIVQADFGYGQTIEQTITFTVEDADWVNNNLPHWRQDPITGNANFSTDSMWARIYQGGQGDDTFNSQGKDDVYVPGYGRDTINLRDDAVGQTFVYRFDSSGTEWTETDGSLTINNFKRPDPENGIEGDRLVLVDMNPDSPYISMDHFYQDHRDSFDINKIQIAVTYNSSLDIYEGLRLIFGVPGTSDGTTDGTNTGRDITINFTLPYITLNSLTSRSNELNYGDYDHKTAHVLFGDTGLLLDPYYDSKITIYDDVVPTDII